MPHSSDSIRPQPKSNLSSVSGIHGPAASGPRAEGLDLDDVPVGAVLEIETGHTTYRLENMGRGKALLSGHPKYCPEPVPVEIQGSLNSVGELKWHFLGIGLKMVFLPSEHGIIRTSPIKSVRAVNPGQHN